MWAMARRIVPPIILVSGGTILFAGGWALHSVPVLIETEVTEPPRPQVPQPTSPLFGPRPWPGARPPRTMQPARLPPQKYKVLISVDEPERRLVKDVTVGGLSREDDGRIRRTYSGEGPALCPT